MKKIIPALVLAAVSINLFAQTSQNEKIAREIFNAFNAYDFQRMLSYYADNAVFQDPAFEKQINEKKTILEHHEAMKNACPDIVDHVQHVYAIGDHVIIEFVSSGTIAPGQKFSLPICSVLTFHKGKVVRDATYYNNSQSSSNH